MKQEEQPDVLKSLARLLGTEIKNRQLEIPEKFGKGYCAGFVFNDYIRMMILNYELNDDIVIENPYTDPPGRMILFKFQNIIPNPEKFQFEQPLKDIPSVLIATGSINPDAFISVHTHTATINIEVDAGYLNSLFNLSEKSSVLRSLLHNFQPLLFEQMIYPPLQKIVVEIMTEPIEETFKMFFLEIKAKELICRLLMELEKRDEKRIYALNSHDVQVVYNVKDQILLSLGTPPVIKDLALYANMSQTKLERLFKQIFGSSIFSYYQGFRIREAARLLKEEKLSVSEVGYRLGFTNLSHFSRVFAEHMGMKPKQFSRS